VFRKTLLLPSCLLLSMSVQAADLAPIMHQLGEKLLQVLPVIYDSNADNEALRQDLDEMRTLFRQAESHLSADPGSRANYDLLMDQLNRSVQYVGGRSAPMMRRELQDAFAVCVSCHKQDKRFVRNYGISKFRDMDEFLAAEYGYLTRDYESAITSYRNYLERDTVDQSRIQATLDHLLSITLEVYADPALALTTFEGVRKSLKKHATDTTDVDAWVATIARLNEDPDDLLSPLRKRDSDGMNWYLSQDWPVVQSALNWNEQIVYWVAIRGQLNIMLRDASSREASADIPPLLYWLAVSDRALHYRFYDSLSRQYLTQCMREYPESDFARECFKEYEMLMIVSFSGSGGIYLPAEAQQELEALRRLVYTSGKPE
jgi:hypothetical protein